MTERKAMVDKSYSGPINRQCGLLELNRSSYYYRPRKISAAELELMRLIDEIHMQYPFMVHVESATSSKTRGGWSIASAYNA